MATTTHHVYNPTGSPVTVNSNSVPARSTAVLTLSDSDAATFRTSGCTTAMLMPGVASPDHIRGFIKGGG